MVVKAHKSGKGTGNWAALLLPEGFEVTVYGPDTNLVRARPCSHKTCPA